MRIKSKRLDDMAAIVGRVSAGNTKMPGSTFALDAFGCQVGGRLAEVPGSVCNACYARKLQAFRPNLQVAWPKNQALAVAAIEADPEEWAEKMAAQIEAIAGVNGELYHRWFDSGDLQSVTMLRAIVRVAQLLPDIRFWLPTREADMVRSFLKSGGLFPVNLVVRISAPMVDDKPLAAWGHTSTVHKHRQLNEDEHACPARTQGNNCGDCRACWDRTVRNVSYTKH
jgi:hypothetical protein